MGLFSGLIGGGSKTSSTSQNYTPNVPQWLMDAYKTNTEQGISQANQPFNYTSSDVVQGFSDDQLNAFNMARGNVGQYQNVYDNALSSLSDIQQQAMNGPTNSQLQNLMNPYTQNVIDATRTGATRQADIERNQINRSSQNAGAFGGSRQAVQNRELNQGLQTQLNNIQYTGLADSYNNAQNQFRTGLNQAAGATAQATNTATAANSYNNTDIGNLLNIGGQQQQLGQQAKNFDFYKNYTQPLEATNYTQQLLNAVPQGMYGYTSTNTQSAPSGGSGLGSLFGGALGLAGLGLPGGGTIGGSLFSSLGGLFGSGAGGMDFGSSYGTSNPAGNQAMVDAMGGLTLANGGIVKGYANGGRVTTEAENSLEKLLNARKSLESSQPKVSSGGDSSGGGLGNILGSLIGGGSSGTEGTASSGGEDDTNGTGRLIGSILGAIAGSFVSPGVGTSVGASLGGAVGGNMAEGGLVSDQNAMGLTIPGMNNPQPQGIDVLSRILSPKQKAIFGSNDNGFKQAPGSGNVMDGMLLPPPSTNQARQPSVMPQPQQMAPAQQPQASTPSPLEMVKQTAGTPSVNVSDSVAERNANDPLNKIIKNTNMPLLTAGLALLGSDAPTFAQAVGNAGLAGVKVALSQQENDANQQAKQAELAAKYLDLKQQADKTAAIESSKAAARDITMRGQDLSRQSAAERNATYKAKTDAIQKIDPTKMYTNATKTVDNRLANDLRLQTKVSKDPTLRQTMIDDQFKEYLTAEQKKNEVLNEVGEQVQELKQGQETQQNLQAADEEEAPALSETANAAYTKLKNTGKYTDAQIMEYLKAKGIQ